MRGVSANDSDQKCIAKCGSDLRGPVVVGGAVCTVSAVGLPAI